MARPKKTEKEKLSKQFSVRLPTATEEKFSALAKKSGLTMSAFLRKVLTEKKSINIVQKNKNNGALWRNIFIHISKSTNNLNQIARQINRLYLAKELTAEKAEKYLNHLEAIEEQNKLILGQAKKELK